MRNLIVLALVAIALVVVGCKSNSPSGQIMGPETSGTGLSGVVNPPPTPIATPAFYGAVSNLNLQAGTFTVVTLAGDTESVVTTPSTIVRYQGLSANVSTSAIKDGDEVTVTGTISGLPGHAKVGARLIVINSSPVNQPLPTPN